MSAINSIFKCHHPMTQGRGEGPCFPEQAQLRSNGRRAWCVLVTREQQTRPKATCGHHHERRTPVLCPGPETPLPPVGSSATPRLKAHTLSRRVTHQGTDMRFQWSPGPHSQWVPGGTTSTNKQVRGQNGPVKMRRAPTLMSFKAAEYQGVT